MSEGNSTAQQVVREFAYRASNQVVRGSSPSGRARNQKLRWRAPFGAQFESPTSHHAAIRICSSRSSVMWSPRRLILTDKS